MKGSVKETVGYILIGVLLAFGLNQTLAFALSTDTPIVAVESNSMVPEFQRGDLLVIQGVPAADLGIGDIVVFSVPDKGVPIVHRLVDRNPDGTFQTKGDANPAQHYYETRIEYSQIHGREIAIIPYLGWVKIGMMEYAIPNMLQIILGLMTVTVIYIGVTRMRGGVS